MTLLYRIFFLETNRTNKVITTQNMITPETMPHFFERKTICSRIRSNSVIVSSRVFSSNFDNTQSVVWQSYFYIVYLTKSVKLFDSTMKQKQLPTASNTLEPTQVASICEPLKLNAIKNYSKCKKNNLFH